MKFVFLSGNLYSIVSAKSVRFRRQTLSRIKLILLEYVQLYHAADLKLS